MQSFDYQGIYDNAYERFTPEWMAQTTQVEAFLRENRKTLVEFFENYSSQSNQLHNWSELKALDLGTGLGAVAHYLAQKGACVSAVDVSPLAITLAKQLAFEKRLKINFIVRDITQNTAALGCFDFIIDSHLFHCLISEQDRKQYFTFVKNNLSDQGILFLESMVFQKNLRIPVGHYLDENFVLWRQSKGQDYPYRSLLTGRELEQCVLDNDLDIDYLYFHSELAINPFPDDPGLSHENLPHLARIAIKKKKAK